MAMNDSSSPVIVAGWDGRPSGVDALVLARLLALPLAADVEVVHVDTGEPTDRDAEADLEQIFGSSGVVAALHRTEAESPLSVFESMAASAATRILVVGSTHRGGWGRAQPGAVSERLLGDVPTPVAIAPRGFSERPEASEDDSYLRVIEVGLDFSPSSLRALDLATELAGAASATMRVVAVDQPLPYNQQGAARGHVAGTSAQPELRDQLAEAIRELPSELRALAIEERSTQPAHILTTRAEQGVDLLVIGSRAHRRLGQMLGSTAASVVRTAPCPVLVAPPA